MKKEFLMSVAGGVLLFSSVAIVPASAATMEDAQYMTQTHTTTKVEHTDYITRTDEENTTQIKPIEKTREATTEELNGYWTTDSNGAWIYKCSDGSSYKGWLKDSENGKWYYISMVGMFSNTYVDGFYLDSSGALSDNKEISKNGVYPSDVEATDKMVKKLLNEGWVERSVGDNGYHWYGAEAELYLPNSKSGAEYNTLCTIKNGVATVGRISKCQSFKEYYSKRYNIDYFIQSQYGTLMNVDLTLDQYLQYKKEGKIGTWDYWLSNTGEVGQGTHCISEYLKNDDSTTTSSK